MGKMRFSIRKKFFLSFLSIVIVLISVSGFSYYEINLMKDNYKNITQNEFSYLLKFQDLQKNILTEVDMIKNYALNKDDTLLNKIDTVRNQNIKDLTGLLANNLTIKNGYDVSTLKLMYSSYISDEGKMIDAIKRGELHVFLIYADKKFAESLNLKVNTIVKNIKDDINNQEIMMNDKITNIIRLIIFANLFTLIFTIAIAFYISKKISIPVKMISKQANRLADGDLTKVIPMVKNKDEIGDLVQSFQHLQIKLRDIVAKIQIDSERVASTSVQLSASVDQTTTSIEQITASIQEMAVSSDSQVVKVNESSKNIDQFKSRMKHITDNAYEASKAATNTSAAVQKGTEVITKAIKQMEDIGDSVENSVQVVNKLNNQSHKIGEIVQLITYIAEQTNLLSLNAAIEAARAGEQGKGFAVVADEVRKLSEQTTEAANNISNMIEEIKVDTENVVRSMNDGSKEVKEGIDIINKVSDSFTEMLDAIKLVNISSDNTLDSLQAMEEYVDHFIQVFDEMKELIEANAGHTQNVATASEEQNASIEEISSSIEELANMAEALKDIINHFKMK